MRRSEERAVLPRRRLLARATIDVA
jgi:hypothetical protein